MGRFGDIYNGKSATPFKFIAADTTVNAGATVTPTSLVADVLPGEELLITVKGKAAAASTSTVTFNFVGRGHPGAPWPTVTDFSVVLTLNGTTEAVRNMVIDGIPFYEIKLLSIVNGDGSNALSAVNAYVGYKH